MGERRGAPGTCVDCGNDAYIRLAAQNGREDMICGHCYAERLRTGAIASKKVPQEPGLKLPRPS